MGNLMTHDYPATSLPGQRDKFVTLSVENVEHVLENSTLIGNKRLFTINNIQLAQFVRRMSENVAQESVLALQEVTLQN